MTHFEVYDKPDHHYRTEIPNIVDDLNLSLAAYRLYGKYKRIAGDAGSCWMSTMSLAEHIGISKPTFLEAKKELLQKRDMLGGKSLILETCRFKQDGSADTNLITIVDIWRVNGDYSKNKNRGGKNSCLPTEGGVVKDFDRGGKNSLPKEEPSQEKPKKQQQPNNAKSISAAAFSDLLKDVDIPQQDKMWLAANYHIDQVRHAIAYATHPFTKLNTTLVQTIKWACTAKPDIPTSPVDNEKENRATAAKALSLAIMPPGVYLEVLNSGVEIGVTTGQMQPVCIEYSAKGFKDLMVSALRKRNVTFKGAK